MESFTPYLIGAGVAILAGLDRTAALQIMISRPLVAGPIVALLLGDVMTGLIVGMLIELLWLCRMPVGASIPYDDTQVAVGATTLAIALTGTAGEGIGLTLCALLIALPLGKIGQTIERSVRARNQLLPARAQCALDKGELPAIEKLHLLGLGNFALGALTTYVVIIFAGRWLVIKVSPVFLDILTLQAVWIKLAFILVGVGSLLRLLNVRRAYVLFCGGFLMTFLLLGVLR